MRTIKIDRKTWLRGGVNMMVPVEGMTVEEAREAGGDWLQEDSMLLRDDGLMCCIGQACSQLGTLRAALEFKSTTDELEREQTPEEFRTEEASARLSMAYSINDDEDTTDAEKEAALVPLFAEMNIQAEFIN